MLCLSGFGLYSRWVPLAILSVNVSVKHESTYWRHYLITSLLETSFLGHFKTLRVGPVPGIESAASRSAVKRSTD